MASTRLADAQFASLSLEGRFTSSYGAAHVAALAILRWHGYRSENRYLGRHSPWQRGTTENTNGPLRQYFPKGTDLARWSAEEIEAVARVLNNRPRKTLGW